MKKNRVIVIGAAGRMGRRLVALIAESQDLELTGALEFSTSPFLGQDAGTVAGINPLGVAISAKLSDLLSNADAIINFSTSGVAESAKLAIQSGVAMVIGTTALPEEELNQIRQLSESGKILMSTNMSLGVNLLFHLVQEAAQILNENYNVEIVEMHHNLKKDAPSGTAITLAERVATARHWDLPKVIQNGRSGIVGSRNKQEIGMHAIRGGDVIGDHTVIFATQGERLELTHKASSRDTFATGALQAVRFLVDENRKNGLYHMQDLLNLR